MKAIKLMILVLFAFGLILPTITGVSAIKPVEEPAPEPICSNEGFNCECVNFYGSFDYYTIEKWSFDGEEYSVDETNPRYSYFNIDVDGDYRGAEWTSSPSVYSVLMKAGNDLTEFEGGLEGNVTAGKHDISHLTFCGYKTNNGGCTGDDCGGNGVPEFPAFSAVAAVLVVTLGLVFIRRN